MQMSPHCFRILYRVAMPCDEPFVKSSTGVRRQNLVAEFMHSLTRLIEVVAALGAGVRILSTAVGTGRTLFWRCFDLTSEKENWESDDSHETYHHYEHPKIRVHLSLTPH